MLFPNSVLILPFHGLVMEHKEHLIMPAMGGIDIPSLEDMRTTWKKWTDNSLKDWLKDGWDIKLLKSNSDVIQKMYGIPISPETTDILSRAKGTIPSPLFAITNYSTVGTSTLTITNGYRFMIATCVGGGGGAGNYTSGGGAGGGGGGCAYKAVYLAAAGNGILSITRGAGGASAAHASGATGTAGTDSTITGGPLTTTLTGGGGGGGIGGNSAGGAGGTVSGADNTTTGGNGGSAAGTTGGSGGGGAGGPTGNGGTGASSGGSTGTAGSSTGGGGGASTGTQSYGGSGGGGVNQRGGSNVNLSTNDGYNGGAPGGDAFFCPPAGPGQNWYNDTATSAVQGRHGGIGGGGGGASQNNLGGDGGRGTAAVLLAA